MRDPLNRTSAPMIVRFFDVCFKQGVIDACKTDDSFEVGRFIEGHRYDGAFGILGSEYEYECDWEMFRFTLYKWARNAGLRSFAENYLLMIRKKNYLWCLLPYCMQFYLLGASEWLDYPNEMQVERFKMEKKKHWSPNSPVKAFTLPDYMSYLHEFAYIYRKLPEDRKQVSTAMMEGFCQAIYALTRKYVSNKYK